MKNIRYTHAHTPGALAAHGARRAADCAEYVLPYLVPGMRVLDIGCGPGSITADFAEIVGPTGEVIGIDNAQAAIDAARAATNNVTFQLGDVYALDFPDNSFDIVHAHQVLQHLGDPVAALKEMRRVSRGWVAARDSDYQSMIWFPLFEGLSLWLESYRTLAKANGAEPDAGRREAAWAREAGFAEVRSFVSAQGFTTPEQVAHFGGTWAKRVTEPNFVSQVADRGIATQAQLDAMVRDWTAWSEHPDAWFSMTRGDILARG